MRSTGDDGARGAALVEAAVTINVLFLFLVGGFFALIAAYKAVSLQYAVAATARWALLGETLDPTASGTDLPRVESIEYKLISEIGKPFGLTLGAPYTIGVNHPNVTICPISNLACSPDDAGVPTDFIQITAIQPINFLSWSFNLSASAIARNEPFVP